MKLGELLAQVMELDMVEPQHLDDSAVAESLCALTSAIHRLEAMRLRLTAAADDRGLAALDGYTNVAAWLASTTVLNDRQARALLRHARSIASDAEVAAAYESGEICDEHAALVTAFLESPPAAMPDDARPAAVQFLLDAARDRDTRVLRSHVARLQHVFDTDDPPPAEDVERNVLHASPTLNGRMAIKADVDAETGDMFLTALSPLSTPRPDESGVPDRRTAGQRRADAFTEILRRYLDSGVGPTEGGERPHLNVSIDAADLVSNESSADRGAYAELFAQNGIGWMPWMGPLSVQATRRLACDCTVAPVVLDESGHPVDLGRTSRLVSTKLRRVLVARDHGCAFPGCGRPPSWCDAHHVRHWVNGGPTDLSNLVLLCRFHHRLVHRGRWEIVMGEDHHPWFVPPAERDTRRQPIPADNRGDPHVRGVVRT